MKITYIGHSGFLVETERHYLLFDYYTGKLPVFLPEKKLTVFVSHSHRDHYNKAIYELQENYRDSSEHIAYVLSKEIRKKHAEDYLRDDNTMLFVKAHESYSLYDGELQIETLKSTDAGVAYIVTVRGEGTYCFYHAGDLNLWKLEDGTKAYNNNIEANFRREMERIRGRKFDAAFVPLDPRLGRFAYDGMDIFLETVKADKVFPMHFWNQPEIIREYLKARPNVKNVVMLEEKGK